MKNNITLFKKIKDKFKSTSFKRKAFELQMSHLAILVVGGGMLAGIVYLVISGNNTRQNEIALRKPMNEARQSLRKLSDDDQAKLVETAKKLAPSGEINQETLSALKNPNKMNIYTQNRGKAYGIDIMFIDRESGASFDGKTLDLCNAYIAALKRKGLVINNEIKNWTNETEDAQYCKKLDGSSVGNMIRIGGRSEKIEEVTESVDTTPDSFSFDILYDVETDTMVESNSITVAGINQETEISISADGEYNINGGSWTSSLGTVENNDTVKVRLMSSSYHSSTVMSTLNIGGVEGDFYVTTKKMNQSPYVSPAIADQTQNEATSFNLDVSNNFNDDDGDTLTYAATGLPSGLSIDENTGVISGTLPSVSSDEVYTVTIQVSDGTDSTSDSFDITIENIS